MANIELWLLEYGYLAIFLLLASGIVGLPIPDETIIVLAGVLVAKKKLLFIPTLLAVYGGGFAGITLSYLLGSICGHFLVTKFGYLLGITPEKTQRAKKWFKDFGGWALLFGYFIPGVRHLTGFISGMMKLSYKQFAIFAYSGLFIWASSLFFLGYIFTQTWQQHLNVLTLVGVLIAITALIAIYSYFFYKQRKLN